MIALIPGQEWSYVTKADREKPKDQQTTFKFKTLSGVQFSAYVQSSRSLIVRLIYGLVGWENFRDSGGQAIQFKKDSEGNCDIVNFGYIQQVFTELAIEHLEHDQLTEGERKN